ncbi:ATP-binding protein [Psychrobacillus sp. MER TA 171]|uniref:two-component system sensor histidine kinase NtrB n=1 Tax=Psychrobacillus sp. MER TA 171 TaxID=2939577 RepID=UPI00203D762E|nr:ATP-binding protein [Psychrobacillus sp. MER TA 171]MCM3358967.1 ATP-binding protein [Psychrobacillus sp. MER TA 171]
MEYINTTKDKNKLFFIIFSCFTVCHIILAIFLHNKDLLIYLYAGIVYLLILTLLCWVNSENPIIQYILFITLNLYLLILNIYSDSVVMIVFFIYPIYIAVIYSNIGPRILLFFITIIEILGLIYYKNDDYTYILSSEDLIAFILLLAILIFTSILNTYFDRKYWNKISELNTSMRKEQYSRESYLQLFFDNAKDSITVFDKDNKIIEVNPAFEDLYGWKREEVIGKSVSILSPQYQLDETRKQEVLKGASYHFLETTDRKKDGTYFDAQITVSPIYDYQNELIALSIISRDVSFKKETENLLLQSEKLKVAGEMAAGVAHEIRNPITVISGFMQIMNGDPTQPYYRYTKVIENEIERINYIISEFLVLAKPHAKLPKKYDLTQTLDDLLVLFQPEINLNGIFLTTDIIKGPIHLYGEEGQMKQVLINLVKNAIEAMSDNGKIHISCSIEPQDIILIKIRDNGVGMDKQVVEKIFDPFFSTKINGTGLGMMISEKIIAEHGGTIAIESQKGQGTTVTIQLPYTSNIEATD